MLRSIGYCLAILLFGATAHAATDPDAAGSQSTDPQVRKGAYLARAADCMSCHTDTKDKPYAGGYPLKSAFGIIYGTNITSDKSTGIGTWSKADFVRALREGKTKDGSYLYPAMPYTSYTLMTDEDMDALWAFIRTVPPINNTIPKNTLPFPLSVRSGMAVWQELYLKQGRFTPTAGKDATWNRGAYLVEVLAHCSDCHTPRNLAQGPEMSHRLTGAQIEGWYAPDISSDTTSKLAYWNVKDLAKFLKTGATPGNAKVFGPMQEVVHDSLQYLSDADLQAMAIYLKDQATSVTPLKPTKVSLPNLAAGKVLYEENCTGCHQRDGRGINSTVPSLAGNGAVTASEPYNVIMALLEGFKPQDKWGAMASFAQTLTDDQIADVANYVRTAWGNKAPANATPWSVGNWRKNAEVQNGAAAMLCPDLRGDIIGPALKVPADQLRLAAHDQGKMSAIVANYTAARPAATRADVIEALSTAYCRTVTTDSISQARMSANIADFAQRVAEVPIHRATSVQ